jgi:hypothetical protein
MIRRIGVRNFLPARTLLLRLPDHVNEYSTRVVMGF